MLKWEIVRLSYLGKENGEKRTQVLNMYKALSLIGKWSTRSKHYKHNH